MGEETEEALLSGKQEVTALFVSVVVSNGRQVGYSSKHSTPTESLSGQLRSH